jgi:signal peptidase I
VNPSPRASCPAHVAQVPRRPRGTLRGWLLGLLQFVRNVLAVVGLLAIIYFLCFDLAVVVSGSMAPTLQGDGDAGSDWMLCERVSYRFRDPRRWEVVHFKTADHMKVAKRVVGLPGEQIAIRKHRPEVDGTPADLPAVLAHLKYFPAGNTSDGRSTPCGSGYYVLGDDSIDSYDSRYEGPIARDAIRSRVWLIVWPPARIGWVEHGW